jgi:uncharacterized protein
MIKRVATSKLKDLATKFKAVAVTGARQTGKTTLVKQVFKGKPYLSLENPDTRSFALEDPLGRGSARSSTFFLPPRSSG